MRLARIRDRPARISRVHSVAEDGLLAELRLVADNVAVLDLALEEGRLLLHELDHARLDLLVDPERGPGGVALMRVDHRDQVGDAEMAVDVEVADADERLGLDVEPLDEDHDRRLAGEVGLPLRVSVGPRQALTRL